MLQSYNKEQAVRRINYLSEQGKPFIFIINYLQSCSYIEEADKLDPSYCIILMVLLINHRPCFVIK